MNVLALFVAAQIIAPTADQVRSIDGWENLTWGMTKAEALQAMPALTSYQELSTSEQAFEGETLGIRDLKMANCHFRAKLVFEAQGGQLAGVILQPIETEGVNSVTQGCHDSALDFLRKSYGPEIKSDSQMFSFDLSWDLGKTEVEFVGIDTSSSDNSVLNVPNSHFLIIYHLLRTQAARTN